MTANSDPITLSPIGTIRTPWKTLADCPHGPKAAAGTTARIELAPGMGDGLMGLDSGEIDLLYWFDRAPRDILQSVSPHDGIKRGVFAMRSPHRPNPIALSRVKLLKVEDDAIEVAGLDCLDGTALLDIKPVPGSGKLAG